METIKDEWRSVESASTETPSLDFIRAVADLLETDAEDILAELGYSHNEEIALVASEN